MEDQEFQNKVDALCAEMRKTLKGQRKLLDTKALSAADSQTLLRDVLNLLTSVSEMQPQQGRADFACFPEMAIFENLTPDQRRHMLAILGEGTTN